MVRKGLPHPRTCPPT